MVYSVVSAHGNSHSLNEEEDGPRWKRKTMTQEVVTSLARQLFPFHGIHHVNERAGESTREKKNAIIFITTIRVTFSFCLFSTSTTTSYYPTHILMPFIFSFSYFFPRNCCRSNW